MKNRYLLGAGAALAVALGCAEANAQFAFMGGPYPVAFYAGPEGGWTQLTNQTTSVTTPASTQVRVWASNGVRSASKKNTAIAIAGCQLLAETAACSRATGTRTRL